MKKIKILTITLFLVISNSLFAQDKQNNPTWEETIEFLQKYIYQIESVYFYGLDEKYLKNGRLIIWSTGIPYGNPSLILDRHYDTWSMSGGTNAYYKRYYQLEDGIFPFKFLTAAENLGSNGLTLKLSKKIPIKFYEKTNYYNKGKIEEGWQNEMYDSFRITFHEDSELVPRLIKAFKHLAYLATEKRKQEREASGDKF
ncbi:hypothetical protein Q2T40_18365 [Winogradskyella maritima]|uniref:DUF4468 domain-containing protein n=1 Tax=Winogradskyella maritima TaxID=1517766 RepID=A0ABV8ADW5_9FLAO|nr:hypothetical protein [Winogradskyella maritima]